MTDDATATPNPASSDDSPETPGAPTPEELLAETDASDPEVGSDGTGMGELP